MTDQHFVQVGGKYFEAVRKVMICLTMLDPIKDVLEMFLNGSRRGNLLIFTSEFIEIKNILAAGVRTAARISERYANVTYICTEALRTHMPGSPQKKKWREITEKLRKLTKASHLDKITGELRQCIDVLTKLGAINKARDLRVTDICPFTRGSVVDRTKIDFDVLAFSLMKAADLFKGKEMPACISLDTALGTFAEYFEEYKEDPESGIFKRTLYETDAGAVLVPMHYALLKLKAFRPRVLATKLMNLDSICPVLGKDEGFKDVCRVFLHRFAVKVTAKMNEQCCANLNHNCSEEYNQLVTEYEQLVTPEMNAAYDEIAGKVKDVKSSAQTVLFHLFGTVSRLDEFEAMRAFQVSFQAYFDEVELLAVPRVAF